MSKKQFSAWLLNRCTESLKLGVVRLSTINCDFSGSGRGSATFYIIYWTLRGKNVHFEIKDSEFIRTQCPAALLSLLVRILKRKMYLEKDG